MGPSHTCQLKWPRTSLPARLESARAGTIEKCRPQKRRSEDEEEGEEIMTVEAEEVEEVAEVEVVALITMNNDGSMALIPEITPSHSLTMK